MNEYYLSKKGFLNRFYLTYDSIELCDMPNKLIIELLDNDEYKKLEFNNISSLKINSVNSDKKLVIVALNISSAQMESINFKICELEEDMFSFMCESIVISD